MSDLGPEARALIEAGRRMDGPPAGAKARVADALKTRIESGAGSTASGAGPWLGGAAALGVAAATIMLWPSEAQDTRGPLASPEFTPPGAFQSTRLTAPSETEEPGQTPEGPTTAPRARPRRVAVATNDIEKVDVSSDEEKGDLLAEARLMAEAQRKLRDSDWTGALERAEAHQKRFPDGMLLEERWGVMALAHCALGRNEAGLALRVRIAARNDASPLLPRIDDRCR